jgi:hypothetical protein
LFIPLADVVVSSLENEMLELRDLISEWKTVPELLNNGVDPTADVIATTSASGRLEISFETVTNSP